MTAAEIRELKVKTFPYLSHDDVRLSMLDSNIISLNACQHMTTQVLKTSSMCHLNL